MPTIQFHLKLKPPENATALKVAKIILDMSGDGTTANDQLVPMATSDGKNWYYTVNLPSTTGRGFGVWFRGDNNTEYSVTAVDTQSKKKLYDSGAAVKTYGHVGGLAGELA